VKVFELTAIAKSDLMEKLLSTSNTFLGLSAFIALILNISAEKTLSSEPTNFLLLILVDWLDIYLYMDPIVYNQRY